MPLSYSDLVSAPNSDWRSQPTAGNAFYPANPATAAIYGNSGFAYGDQSHNATNDVPQYRSRTVGTTSTRSSQSGRSAGRRGKYVTREVVTTARF